MPSITQFALGLLQALCLLAVAPLVTGFSRVIRARVQCRSGPGLLCDYHDILNLLRRQEILPFGAGRVFLYVPYVMLSTLLLVAMSLPVLTTASPIAAAGDLIAVIYLLALVRFAFSLCGIDSNNPFAVTGASRELTMGVLVEPTMLLSLIVAALLAGSTNLGTISEAYATGKITSAAAVVAAIAFAVAMYFEMGKVPFDMAEAEQELQEGPLIEYSGAGLGLMRLCLGLKQVLMAALLIGVFIPFGAASEMSLPRIGLAAVLFAIKLPVVFFIIGLLESSTARARFLFVSRSTWAGFAVSVLAFALYLVRL
jgi:formate hydrogenlyase subunit 4